MKICTDPKKVEEILSRGVEEIIDRDHLKKRLLSGEKLRIKHGIDPTGPNIHIGRASQFLKLRDFQELGHQIVLVFGDFTAQIGDASDKLTMRKPLAEWEVKQNMKNYPAQIGKILDMEKVELCYNSQWLEKMDIKDLLYLSMRFTVQQLIHRRNFKERWEKGQPIGLHELDYPLLQGYDSVKVRADIELGGFDQLFNLKVGREIQKILGMPPQDIITLRMLFGLDGRKMSTTWGNVINITDSPAEQFGKIMSMKDDLILDYFELCTRVPLKEIRKMKEGLKRKKINPRDLKAKLGREIVTFYHTPKAAEFAQREFEKVFKEKELPTKIPEILIKEKSLDILDLLIKTKLARSRSEAKRLILQKGVKINGKTQEDWQKMIKIERGTIIQVGKRKFAKII